MAVNNLTETTEYFAVKAEAEAVNKFCDYLVTPDTEGNIGAINSLTAVVNVSYNDGSSQRIHTSPEFNKYLAALIKDNAAEFFQRTRLKTSEAVAKEKAEATAEITGEFPDVAGGPQLPVINGALAASGKDGAAFTYALTAANLSSAQTFSWAATGLPASLTLDPATGIITGTPVTTDVGPHTVNITLTTSVGNDTETLIITIEA